MLFFSLAHPRIPTAAPTREKCPIKKIKKKPLTSYLDKTLRTLSLLILPNRMSMQRFPTLYQFRLLIKRDALIPETYNTPLGHKISSPEYLTDHRGTSRC